MTDQLRFRILGCGSSGGVPRLGGNWGACDPNNPKNARTRCSLLVERQSKNGRTQVLIDTSQDMRAQLLQAQVGRLDAVLYTHDHADHVHGLDDLRMIVFNRRSRLPVWANQVTSAGLLSRFSYAFKQPEGSAYPPILQLNHIEGPVKVDGAGGQIEFTPRSSPPALAMSSSSTRTPSPCPVQARTVRHRTARPCWPGCRTSVCSQWSTPFASTSTRAPSARMSA